jgi:hypothetical protein
MFKATARLYRKRREVMAQHPALGDTVARASEQALKKLLDEVSSGGLRLLDWHSIETVVTHAVEP